MPLANDKTVDKYLPYLNAALDEFHIDTLPRRAAFIAQIAHETGSLHYMSEIWGPTAAQLRYDKMARLGNMEEGDGYKYRGRGAFQLTGRANYKRYGDLLNVDLENNPEWAKDPSVAFRIAGQYWKEHHLNEMADNCLFESITRAINGGINGLPQRRAFYERALELLR